MQYEIALENLVKKALKQEEIQDGLHQIKIKKEHVSSKILEKSSKILEAGGNEINELEKLKNHKILANEELSKIKKSILLKILEKIQYFIPICLLVIIILMIISKYLGWSLLPYFIAENLTFDFFVVAIGIATLLLLIRQIIKKPYSFEINRIKREFGLDGLDGRISLSEKKVEDKIIEKGILPEIREIINEQLTPSYDLKLKSLSAPGLSEVFDPLYEIPTESKKKLGQLLNIMPGGSIGLAGPRGAGKSTLMLSFCSDSGKEIKGRPVLSIITSAPVEYETRDFILHIFASICNKFLKNEDKSIKKNSHPLKYGIFPFHPLSVAGLYIGLFLMMLGVSRYFLDTTTDLITSITTSISSMLASDKLFYTGFFLMILSMLPIYTEIKKNEQIAGYEDDLISKKDDLIFLAQESLDKIKFQRSYTSGWSGSMKFPILEAGVNTATTLSQKQMSLPEIIDDYKYFLNKISEKYTVIIGIDELDKLSSNENAHNFLNEIKAIFGLENCFYLISVSENAMSSFERRGLPLRDVFDSSFDDIIYVNYLNLDAVKNLIKRRVIGMPIPFICFCYCMSAGLARDLIRICRNLIELVRLTPNENSLSNLCGSLLKTDLMSKLNAVSIEVKEIMLEPEATEFFKDIKEIERKMDSIDSLLKFVFNLQSNAKTRNQYQGSEDLVNLNKIASLRNEIESYLYYSVTMMQFFSNKIDEKAFMDNEISSTFDMLAKARQFLSVNPAIARSIITDFRESHKMSTYKPQNLS